MRAPGNNSAHRLVAVLKYLSVSAQAPTALQISDACEIPKSSTHQLLNVMAGHDLVEYNAQSKVWTLGPACAYIGSAYFNTQPLQSTLQPYLHELSDELGMTSHFGKLDGLQVVYLQKVTSAANPIKLITSEGSRLPAYQAALGVALLSKVSDERLSSLVMNSLDEHTSEEKRTVLEQLERDVAMARQQGVAVEDGRISSGVTCVAAAITPNGFQNPLAIGVTGLSTALQGEALERTKEAVMHVAGKLLKRFSLDS